MTNMSSPRTFSCTSTNTSMSAKRRTCALVNGSFRYCAMASASALLELPASSFMPRAPFGSPMDSSRPCDGLMTAFSKQDRRGEGRLALFAQQNRRNLSSVIAFAAMRGAAVTEERSLVGIGTNRGTPYAGQSCRLEPRFDKRLEIELKMMWPAARAEETLLCRIGRDKSLSKVRSDLVGVHADAGPDRSDDSLALRTQRLHLLDRVLEYAGKGALPASMRCTDDPGAGVSQQNGRAICCKNPKRNVGNVCDHRVGFRSVFEYPGFFDLHRPFAVDLAERHEGGSGRQGLHRAAPIFLDVIGCVL